MPRQFHTGDQTLVRQLNRSPLLLRLWVGSPVSRADLAVTTGRNKTTVSGLEDELRDGEFVREDGGDLSISGRPGALLELDPVDAHRLRHGGGVALVLHDFLSRPRLVPYARALPHAASVEPGPRSVVRDAVA